MRTLTWQWIAAEDPCLTRASEPVEQQQHKQQHRLLAGADVIAPVKRHLVGHVQNCDDCGQLAGK